jgi:hypothetical protein
VGFAHAGDEESGDYRPVVLRAEGFVGRTWLNNSNMPWEKEWLSHGQFGVIHKASDPEHDVEHEIHLRALQWKSPPDF